MPLGGLGWVGDCCWFVLVNILCEDLKSSDGVDVCLTFL